MVTVIVHKEVFPPYLTISTNIFIDFIETLALDQKTVLELGCGSGLISIFSAKKGAKVTASDINLTALSYLKKSAQLNHVTLSIRYSNLFKELKEETFDYVFINPPYYQKAPANIKEQAWFCGSDFEYFKQLFLELPTKLTGLNHCYMILSEDCQLEIIIHLAQKENLTVQKVFSKNVAGEENYIFKLDIK